MNRRGPGVPGGFSLVRLRRIAGGRTEGDPVTAFASGWMRVRGRARQLGIELPLVVSDHVDWPELIQTVIETEAEEIWVTHGREDALVHYLGSIGRKARALALVGYGEEAE